MRSPGSDIASIALGILVGLVVALAFYFYFVAEFEPTEVFLLGWAIVSLIVVLMIIRRDRR